MICKYFQDTTTQDISLEADWGCLLLVIIPRWGWDDKLQIRPRLVSTVLLLGNPSSTIIHGCKLAAETTLGTTTSTTALERKHPFLFIRPFIDIASSFIAPAAGNKTKEDLCTETRLWSTGCKSIQSWLKSWAQDPLSSRVNGSNISKSVIF